MHERETRHADTLSNGPQTVAGGGFDRGLAADRAGFFRLSPGPGGGPGRRPGQGHGPPRAGRGGGGGWGWGGVVEVKVARPQILSLISDPQAEAQFKDVMLATSAQIGAVQKSLEAMALTDADKAQMAQRAHLRQTAVDLRDQALQRKSADQQAPARAVLQKSYEPAVAIYLQGLQDFVRQQQRNAQQSQQEMDDAHALIMQITAVTAGLLILLIIVGAHYLIGSMQRPLAQANALVERMAGGGGGGGGE